MAVLQSHVLSLAWSRAIKTFRLEILYVRFSFIQVVCHVSHFIIRILNVNARNNRFCLTTITVPKHVADKHNIN